MEQLKIAGGGINRNITPSENLTDLIKCCPKNKIIGDNLVRAWSIINSSKYKKIVCSVSGGSDSDIMLDICYKCDKDKKIDYVWFDTGLEYQATKEHLKYLEQKYGIEIIRYKAIKSIPMSCKLYGQPFISKNVSEFIQRLQKHEFNWENNQYEELCNKYLKCDSALQWWCDAKGDKSHFNISQNKYLKEFILDCNPNFKISNKCCLYAKKNVAHKLIRENNYDLNIVGVRKAEGGVRSTRYKNCFDEKSDNCDVYRPLFWYKDQDKLDYENHYNITHSKCYTEYGLKRTGCAGCPYGRDFEYELEIIRRHEPKLYKAVNNIFGDSYEYTRKYKQFCKEMKDKEHN